jgi:hypothetical protein
MAYAQARTAAAQTVFAFMAVAFTAVAAAAAIAAAFYAKKAADETEKGANAAEGALRATRQGERRQLRAYVHISKATYKDDHDGQRVELLIRNFGQTPAHDVWVERAGSVRDFPLTQPLAPLVRDDSLFDIAPHGEGATILFPFAEWDDPSPSRFGGGGTALYIHGVIHYRDAFKKDRETHFRLFVRSPSDRGVSPAGEGNHAT